MLFQLGFKPPFKGFNQEKGLIITTDVEHIHGIFRGNCFGNGTTVTFILLLLQDGVEMLLDYVNTVRPSVKFTLEQEIKTYLAFQA